MFDQGSFDTRSDSQAPKPARSSIGKPTGYFAPQETRERNSQCTFMSQAERTRHAKKVFDTYLPSATGGLLRLKRAEEEYSASEAVDSKLSDEAKSEAKRRYHDAADEVAMYFAKLEKFGVPGNTALCDMSLREGLTRHEIGVLALMANIVGNSRSGEKREREKRIEICDSDEED